MNGCLSVFLKRCVLMIAVISLTMAVNNPNLHAYGGSDGGGSDGGDGVDSTVTISVWDVPFDLPDAPGVSGGSIELATPQENRMRAAWQNFGGQAGTGKTFEQWQRSSQAGRVLQQHDREDQMQLAHSGARRSNVTVVALDVLDGAGQASQFVLSWVPGVGTGYSIGLDVGRAFADRYKQATAQGYSYSDAVAAGMQDATLKGATSLISSLTFGRLADHHTNQIKNLTDMSYQSVDTAIYHGLGYMGTKVVEQTVTYGADAARDQVMDRMPRNSARPVSSGPTISVGTYGVTHAAR